MSKLEITKFSNELFKNNLITKVELEKFKAEEKALKQLFDYDLNEIKKRQEISILHLNNLKNQIIFSKQLINKVKKISLNDSDSLNIKRNILIENLMFLLNDSTENLILNFSDILPIEYKNELNKQIEFKK